MSELTYSSAHSTHSIAQSGVLAAATKPAGRAATIWCGLLLLSLSYELPLYELTAYDRVNPRMFDVVLILALLFSGWRLRIKNAFVGSWLAVTLVFSTIGILSFLFLLPEDYRYFSLFYSLKYVEILLFLLVLSGFDWTRDQIVTLIKCFAVGVALAGIWGLLQELGVLSSERYLPSGERVILPPGAILATYGTTYFHSGTMGAMAATVALALRMENRAGWLWFIPVFLLAAFLALFSGSRAGLALFLFASSLISFRKALYVMLGICIATAIMLLPGVVDYLIGESITIQRILDTEHANSVDNRLSASIIGALGRLIDYHGAGLFLYGGGFYAVPVPDVTGLVKYRVGYGVHNIHFFPLEQAGILGLLACLSFWASALVKGWRARASILGASGLALLLGTFVIGWAGQIFFLGFGTENMLAAQLGVFFLLLSYTNASGGEGSERKLEPMRGFLWGHQGGVHRSDEALSGEQAASHSLSASSISDAPGVAQPRQVKADDPNDSPLSRFLER